MSDSFEAKLHNVMREMGIVPPAEDYPLQACSTLYRENLFRALEREGIDDGADRIHELEAEVRGLEADVRHEESKVVKLSDEVSDLVVERNTLNRELGDALDKIKRLQLNTTSARESAQS